MVAMVAIRHYNGCSPLCKTQLDKFKRGQPEGGLSSWEYAGHPKITHSVRRSDSVLGTHSGSGQRVNHKRTGVLMVACVCLSKVFRTENPIKLIACLRAMCRSSFRWVSKIGHTSCLHLFKNFSPRPPPPPPAHHRGRWCLSWKV